MYKNQTAVLYDDTAGGVCSFCRLFNVKCFLESAVSAVTGVTGVNMYDIDKSNISTVLLSAPSVEKL